MFKKKASGKLSTEIQVSRVHSVHIGFSDEDELTIDRLEEFVQKVRAEGRPGSVVIYGTGHGGWMTAYVHAHGEES